LFLQELLRWRNRWKPVMCLDEKMEESDTPAQHLRVMTFIRTKEGRRSKIGRRRERVASVLCRRVISYTLPNQSENCQLPELEGKPSTGANHHCPKSHVKTRGPDRWGQPNASPVRAPGLRGLVGRWSLSVASRVTSWTQSSERAIATKARLRGFWMPSC
jgi:hypothetical protein